MTRSTGIITERSSGLVLGVHIGHDRSAALVENGKLIAHIAQERLDRVKMSPGGRIPFEAIVSILNQTGRTIRNVDAVGFSFENCTVDRIAARFEEDLACYFDLPRITTIPVSHHLAHAWGVYALSGFKGCAVLVCDGAGEFVSDSLQSIETADGGGFSGGLEGESLFLAEGDTLELCCRRLQSFLHDIYDRPFFYNASQMPDIYASQSVGIGRKYEQFTYFIGFGNEQHGKTMGLASYGQPLVDLRNWPVCDFSYKLTLADILREIEERAIAASMPMGAFLRRHRADAASTVQRFTEESLVGLASCAKRALGKSKLCISGGVFLNCVANHKLAQARLFNELFAMPACGDEGQALGAAFAVSAMLKGRFPRSTTCDTSSTVATRAAETTEDSVPEPLGSPMPPVVPYAGLCYDRATVESAIRRNKLCYKWHDDEDLAEEIAAMIETGRTVGVLRGRSELGPRALGHRSIFADPRSSTMKNHLNEHVKFREAFRPYAPIVLAEYATDIFDLPQPSPFMLFACDVRAEFRGLLPAITHVDGTARVQTIDEQEPFLRALLMSFYRRTGIAVLLNTSFNLAGEPIVETPEDAIRAFLSCGLDTLVLEGAVITKEGRHFCDQTGSTSARDTDRITSFTVK
jgi:carbamoyltransferase